MEEERDLLGWWKNNSGIFPLLSSLAHRIFSIPASSSSSERNFSAAGLTFNQRRTALKPSTVDAVLFLHNAYWKGYIYVNSSATLCDIFFFLSLKFEIQMEFVAAVPVLTQQCFIIGKFVVFLLCSCAEGAVVPRWNCCFRCICLLAVACNPEIHCLVKRYMLWETYFGFGSGFGL